MVERKILESTILIIITALVIGYSVGQFSGQVEQSTSATTSIITTTQATTSSTTITKILYISTTIFRMPYNTLSSPTNSTAIIRNHLLFDSQIFLTFSIDKPEYSLGENIHIKGNITNLTLNHISFDIGHAMIRIVDENTTSLETVWVSPELVFQPGLGPAPMDSINLKPIETISLDWATTNWNMTGLHKTNGQVTYNDFPIPEGQYALIWRPQFYFSVNEQSETEKVNDTIQFTITKQD